LVLRVAVADVERVVVALVERVEVLLPVERVAVAVVLRELLFVLRVAVAVVERPDDCVCVPLALPEVPEPFVLIVREGVPCLPAPCERALTVFWLPKVRLEALVCGRPLVLI